ncbi:MAG: hypothetical protein ACOYO1_10085 [Bacteroidales bacterium]
MKFTKLLSLLIVFTMIGLYTTSCKKDSKDEKLPDSASMQQLAQDEVAIESYSNEALEDANEVLSKNSLKSISALPCNATIDSVLTGDTMTYTVTYNGLNCNGNKFKTGQMIFKRKITAPWSQAGTSVTLQFVNFKVTKVLTQKWIMLNGIKTWTNVSGGLIKNLGNGTTTSVVHTIIGSLQATFSDTTSRIWNIARKKTFTGIYPGALLLSIEGLGNSNGYNNLATWGINRHNENFYTQINQAVVLKQSCGWDPISGIKVHQIPSDSKSATTTFGFDSNNQPITGNACPTRLKIDWVKGSFSGTLFLNL